MVVLMNGATIPFHSAPKSTPPPPLVFCGPVPDAFLQAPLVFLIQDVISVPPLWHRTARQQQLGQGAHVWSRRVFARCDESCVWARARPGGGGGGDVTRRIAPGRGSERCGWSRSRCR
eukprot:COSAG06_NODE_2299_length_7123_cov_118.808941_8_plen_118_part_00